MKIKIFTLFLLFAVTLMLFSCDTPDNSGSSGTGGTQSGDTDDYGEVNTNINNNIKYDASTYAPYDIYPTPHKIEYQQDYYYISSKINVVFESEIDAPTKKHLYNTLSLKNMIATESSDKKSGKNVLIGTYDSNGVVSKYVDLNSLGDLYSKIDAYYLEINANDIIILGKDTDACYYAITTLQWIFEQTTTTIQTLKVKDYSDSFYRGFIEGYYGIPWTPAERIELMEFGSKVKSNIYIYAPKDDSYHSSNWRALYDQSDLLDLKEQIQAGIDSKTRFAWSIHPFISDPITTANYEADYAAIIAKFEQLYENGVRQFVISADDVYVSDTEEYDVAVQTRLLNDVSEWCRSKGDCYKLIFVPSAYCTIAQESLNLNLYTYFEKLCDGLDQDVEIMWTGALICSSVKNGDFDLFTELTGRKAFMWLNWPVNDYCMDALIMSKGEVLNDRLEYDEELQFTGIVTNPMQQAEPSKVSIFAVADYCWNINGFDMDKSYEASFYAIEPTATRALKEVCSHMTNGSTFEEKYFEESTQFTPYVDGFEERYLAGDLSYIETLIELYNEVIRACDYYLENATNLEFKASIEPWVNSLRLLCEESIIYLNVLKDPNADNALELYEAAVAIEELRKECRAPILDIYTHNLQGKTVRLGISKLLPFLETLDFLAKDEVYLSKGLYSGVTYRGYKSVYEGKLDNIIDNDLNSYAWFEDHPKVGAFIRIDLGEETVINDIKILQGNGTNHDCLIGDIEISNDGRTFIKIGEVSGLETLLDLRTNPVTARYIRLVNTDTHTWVAIRDVSINTLGELEKFVKHENIELETSVSTSIYNMFDNDLETFTWFADNKNGNAILTLDLLEVNSVSHIGLYMSKVTSPEDYFHHYEVLYSIDGIEYISVGEYHDAEFDYYFDSPVNLKYVKVVSKSEDNYGIVVRELTADNATEGVKLSTNCTVHQYTIKNALDNDKTTFVWVYPAVGDKLQNNCEFVLDLKEVTYVNNIHVTFTSDSGDADYLQGYKISYSTNGVDYIELVDVLPNDTNVRDYICAAGVDARYIKLSGTADITNWIKLYEFNVD